MPPTRYMISVDLCSHETYVMLRNMVEEDRAKLDPEMTMGRFIRELIRKERQARKLILNAIPFTGKGNELKDLPSIDPETVKD